MKKFAAFFLSSGLLFVSIGGTSQSTSSPNGVNPLFGFRNSAEENAVESRFLAVPDSKLAEAHLRTLTQAPHMAGTPEDKATAEYVAKKFREAGLETEIVEYKVWMNYPSEISVDVTAPVGVTMHGPTREHVDGDPYQDDPRVVMPFNGMSPSGDVEGEVVYANYGSPQDFKKLEDLKVDVRGKIVLVRYGENFRGVKAFVAQEHGAAGVLIYSDPADDGWRRGDKYPQGPWRPDTGVQRGSIGYMFQFPGDPTTPGVASVPSLPDSKRVPPQESAQLPKIPTTPLSYADAWPILEHLLGPDSPRDWQGSLPFTYHVGPGPTKVRMHLKQDYQYRTIWVGSWDAEEEGLIGSTEWGEQHASDLANAPAYFNMDVAVSGAKFGASSVPSLKQFLRDVTKVVPSPKGGMLYDEWRKANQPGAENAQAPTEAIGDTGRLPAAQGKSDVPVGDLGSGSDYTVFLQHLGVPSTDVSSTGSYGVYHSVFDNFAWFKKFGDPDFTYEQEMARVYGIEAIRMADADVLPYDYEEYAKEITAYIEAAKKKAGKDFGSQSPDFKEATDAAHHFEQAAAKVFERGKNPPKDPASLNQALRQAERALLIPDGLPNRPWFHHAIYAPGQYTGYAAVVIPGVNEAIDRHDVDRTREQISALAAALNRATKVLESYR